MQQIKDNTRVLVCAALELHGVALGTSHHCLPWAVQNAGQLIPRSHKGRDGFRRGSETQAEDQSPGGFAAWCEKFWYLPHNKKKAQQTPKFEEGPALKTAAKRLSSERLLGAATHGRCGA